jgi:hypothetical protein
VEKREVTITAKISRKVWFQFASLCRSHGVRVYAGLEESLRDTLRRAGVAVEQESE